MGSVNLKSIQFKQPTSSSSSQQQHDQQLSGARLFVAALQWAHCQNIHSQVEEEQQPAAVCGQTVIMRSLHLVYILKNT